MRQRGQKWRTWEMAGLFAALLLGNTLHFVYDWTGQARWAAYLAATNESTWEHMKLLAVPWVLWTIAECIGLRSLRPAGPRAAGLLAGLTAIPLLFYGYVGVIGFHAAVVDVLIFQAAVLLAFWVSTALQKRGTLTAPVWQAAGPLQAGLCSPQGPGATTKRLRVFSAELRTSPPELPVFIDPTNGTRGIPS